jgi:hypothetical protein
LAHAHDKRGQGSQCAFRRFSNTLQKKAAVTPRDTPFAALAGAPR